MTSRVRLSIGAMLTGAALVHCSTRVMLGTQETEDGGPDAADVVVGDADVDADVSDAAVEDEFEIPDGAVTCDAAPCAVAIAASNKFNFTGPPFDHFGSFCALLADKTIQCWGSNLHRRLGVDVDAGAGLPMSSSPVRVEGVSDVTSMDVGGANACVSIADGGVLCWGAPALISAGIDADGGPPLAEPALPVRQDLVPSATRVAVGDDTACVTTPAGKIVCWGNNQSQQLARPAGEPFLSPAEIPLGDRAVVLAAPGVGITFALTTQGAVFSWGSTDCVSFTAQCTHRLGRDSSEAIDPVPTFVPGIGGARALALSSSHACTIAGRFVQCWGGNRAGELGRGKVHQYSELPAPTVLAQVIDADDADGASDARPDVPLHVAADDGRTCAVMASGRVYCWGFRGPEATGTPFRVEGLSGPAVAVAIAGRTSCALVRSGIVECWGSNRHGLLGRGVDDPQLDDPKPGAVRFSQ